MMTLRILQSLTVVNLYTSVTEVVTAFTLQQQQYVQRSLHHQRPGVNSRCVSSSLDYAYQQPKQWTTKLHMGWGPEPIWSAAAVSSVSDACPSGKSISMELSVPSDTFMSYVTPGQYVQVKPVGDDDTIQPAFLAICSAPPSTTSTAEETGSSSAASTSTFHFLVKRTGNNEWLTEATAGAAIQVSQVLGNGYNIVENIDGLKYDFPTQNILLFAAGSGIAPIAAAISSGRLDTSNRSCRLYYGERSSADLCFVEQFIQWENMGIEVVPVLSQPDDDWNGRCGYVQTALSEDGIPIPRNTGALLCGMKGMTESVKELLLSAGVFDGRVLFNF